MQMVLYLTSKKNSARMYPYLGISEKTRLLCGHAQDSQYKKNLKAIKELTISAPVAERQMWSPFIRCIADPLLHAREMEWLLQMYTYKKVRWRVWPFVMC